MQHACIVDQQHVTLLGLGLGLEVTLRPVEGPVSILAIYYTGCLPADVDVDVDVGILTCQAVIRRVSKYAYICICIHIYIQVKESALRQVLVMYVVN